MTSAHIGASRPKEGAPTEKFGGARKGETDNLDATDRQRQHLRRNHTSLRSQDAHAVIRHVGQAIGHCRTALQLYWQDPASPRARRALDAAVQALGRAAWVDDFCGGRQ